MAEPPASLVTPDWIDEHGNDPNVRLIEIDWDGTDSYREAHIPGAVGWNWKDALWDPLTREFPSRDEFAQRLGRAGISNDTTVVFHGRPVQFGTYGWWVFKYCGHEDARILDGGHTRWIAEGRPLTKTVPDVSPAQYRPTDRAEHMRASRDDVLMALVANTDDEQAEYPGINTRLLATPPPLRVFELNAQEGVLTILDEGSQYRGFETTNPERVQRVFSQVVRSVLSDEF